MPGKRWTKLIYKGKDQHMWSGIGNTLRNKNKSFKTAKTREVFLMVKVILSLMILLIGLSNINGNIFLQGSAIGYMDLGSKAHDINLNGLIQYP